MFLALVAGRRGDRRACARARFALWKNRGNLTERQQLKLARIQKLNQRLYRAYLLAQQLRQIYRVGFDQAIALLDAWRRWARLQASRRAGRSGAAAGPSL